MRYCPNCQWPLDKADEHHLACTRCGTTMTDYAHVPHRTRRLVAGAVRAIMAGVLPGRMR